MLLAALLAGALTGSSPQPSDAPRNIVVVITDDQGLEMGCYGHPVIKTPRLDELAAESTRFLHAFCTTASCSASRSVLLTGLHNHANGHYGHQHSYHKFSSFPKVKSLPSRLGEAGWHTVRIGKYHVAPEEVYPFETALTASARNPVAMAKTVGEFLEKRDARPFFLWFATSDPHRGGGADASIPGRPNRFGNRAADKAYRGVTPRRYSPEEVVVPPFLPDNVACRAELAQYYQSVSRIDQGVGELVQTLKDAGVWQTTMLVFLSDHGIAFPGAKTTVYEPGLRCPLLVRDPTAAERPATSEAMVSWVDLAPSLLEFAGVEAAADEFHGRSFLASARGGQDPAAREWDEVYASHTFHEVTMYYPMRVVHERRWKLIFNIAHGLPYPFASDLWVAPTWQSCWRQGPDTMYGARTVNQYVHRPRFELFDLEADPDEASNLADDPEHAAQLARLQGKLRAFMKETGDPWLLKWDRE